MLRYRTDPLARPLRPMLRLLRAGGRREDVVLPGAALDAAHWLGLLPGDVEEIRIAAEPGFVLERVGARGHASLFAECLLKRPLRLISALYAGLRSDERRYRDILRGACAVAPMRRYATWKAVRLRASEPAAPSPGFAIRLIVPDGPGLSATIDSLRTQDHAAWRMLVAAAGGAEPSPFPDARVGRLIWDERASATDLIGEAGALCFLRPGDRLAPGALGLLAARLRAADAPDLVYADEEAGTAPRPRLKPDWSTDLALVTGYLGAPVLLARALVERIGIAAGSSDGLDLTLAAVPAARHAVHIPRILCRRASVPEQAERRADALARHLRAVGSPARPLVSEDMLDLAWPLPEPAPLVSIVIPSRDRLDLIGRVTDGVLHQTAYPALELVIVDNGSTEPAVLALYESLQADPRVRIEPRPGAFDFSSLTNAGVRAARGSVLVLLNNDIAVLRPDWLSALVRQAVRPEVGAVGAKLLYADGRLQHAGVVVGLGGRAGHILRRRPGDSAGHLGRLRVAHEVSAVTAACLAVERTKYEAVGGLDAATFPIDFNDVDLCLRLAAAGFKTVWTPHAVLSHLESVSRGPPSGEARRRFEREADAFVERWRDVIRHDPFHHPALSLTTFGEDLE